MKFTIALSALLTSGWFPRDAFAQTPVDTLIWASNPNTSYGSATTITVDQDDGGNPTRGLVKFNGLSIDAGQALVSATLRINSINPTGGTISAYRMIDPWNESSTWNFLSNGNPSRESTASFTIPSPSSGVVLQLDVTSDVQGWLMAPSTNQGWIFINSSTDGWDFSSAESSNPPELVLATQASGGETETVIVNADFNSGTNEFTYRDDPFFVSSNHAAVSFLLNALKVLFFVKSIFFFFGSYPLLRIPTVRLMLPDNALATSLKSLWEGLITL